MSRLIRVGISSALKNPTMSYQESQAVLAVQNVLGFELHCSTG